MHRFVAGLFQAPDHRLGGFLVVFDNQQAQAGPPD
jgi:hypothetical protein